jgi:hypothetical protein
MELTKPTLDRDVLREVARRSIRGQQFVTLNNFKIMYMNRFCRQNALSALKGLRDFYFHRLRAKFISSDKKFQMCFNFEQKDSMDSFQALIDCLLLVDPSVVKSVHILETVPDLPSSHHFKPQIFVKQLARLKGNCSPFDYCNDFAQFRCGSVKFSFRSDIF